MRVMRFTSLIYCLVLFTPMFSVAETNVRVELSEPIAQYVWDTTYAAHDNPDNKYSKQFLKDSYEAFWPDPTPATRALLYRDPGSEYIRSLLGITYLSGASQKDHSRTIKSRDITQYSLHWPVMLEQYFQFTGDDAYVRDVAKEILPKVMGHFEKLESKRGLLRSPSTWPKSLRTGIDYSSMKNSEDALTNAFYYRALVASSTLYQALGLDASPWREKAHAVKAAYHQAFGKDRQRLFVDAATSNSASISTNALAICFGLTPESAYPSTIELIRKSGMNCAPSMVPYVIEACFIAQESQLAIDLLSFMHDFNQNPEALYLFPKYIFGVYPETPGWNTVGIAPRIPYQIKAGTLQVPIPSGKLSVDYLISAGMSVTIPLECRAIVDSVEGMNIVVKKYKSHSNEETLTSEDRALLKKFNWADWAGTHAAIWVDIDTQMLRVIQGDTILYQARCASAEKGVGSKSGSLKTPLGWHSIHGKLGDNADWGQVFRSRVPTDEIWTSGQDTTEDLVLSRVILLTGEEPGLNQGGSIDSLKRHIYIHGTNDEARIGIPSSHGCIRMTNDDVIDVYTILEPGMKVLITASD